MLLLCYHGPGAGPPRHMVEQVRGLPREEPLAALAVPRRRGLDPRLCHAECGRPLLRRAVAVVAPGLVARLLAEVVVGLERGVDAPERGDRPAREHGRAPLHHELLVGGREVAVDHVPLRKQIKKKVIK